MNPKTYSAVLCTWLVLLCLAIVGLFLVSCAGPRSYQVESHAGGGAIATAPNGAAMMVAPMGVTPAQAEAQKAQAFFGR